MLKKIFSLCTAMLAIGVVCAQPAVKQGNNALYGNLDAPLRGIYNHHLSHKVGNNQSKTILFDTNDIEFWTGNGTNSAVLIVAWDDDPVNPATALAWGVRWNGNATAADLFDTVATHDNRFSYSISSGFMTDIAYDDGTLNPTSELSYWCYYVNGLYGIGYANEQMADGDVIEVSSSCNFTMTTATAVTNPNNTTDTTITDTTYVATDTAIAFSEVLYWLGSGSNEVVMAVNWAYPDTALAWGFRYDDNEVSLKSMMDTIALRDPRFSYQAGAYGPDDILFVADTADTLRLSHPNADFNYWWLNINGVASSVGYDALMLHHGDFVKWGDPNSGIVIDTAWGYPSEIVWQTPVHPVSIPTYEDTTTTDTTYIEGPFCGAVGSEGCTAIACTSDDIKAWATACSVVRGSQNLADPTAPPVTYGTEADATGAATTSTMDVVSLGDGGYATLTFDLPIANGEGYDFAVFENSFNDSFLELAFVEVSSDGINYVRFPATSLTPTTTQIDGNGSVDPTFINNLAGKYRAGWGTPFDLDELSDSANLDLNNITHVRVVDVVGSIDTAYCTYDAEGNIVNDPFPTPSYSAGFDLDGVAVLHQKVGINTTTANSGINAYPIPARCTLWVSCPTANNSMLTLYDMTGRKVQQVKATYPQTAIDVNHLPNGIYVVSVGSERKKVVVRH